MWSISSYQQHIRYWEKLLYLPLLAAWLVLAGTLAAAAAGTITSDESALLALTKEFTNWNSYYNGLGLQGWQPQSNPCHWSQVSCNTAGRVSVLSLKCDRCTFMLRGIIPQSLLQLDALTDLDASGNSISGTLPPQWSAQGAFRQLARLDLSDNVISGGLPNSWAIAPAFPQLTFLNLSYNSLSGPLPQAWTSPTGFRALISLSVSDNGLTGTLPPGLGSPESLPALSFVDIAGNSLNGNLPEVWGAPGALPLLKILDASRNYLNGTLPLSWGNNSVSFPNLTILSLYANRLSGQLPEAWGSGGGFKILRQLYLDSNSLTGALPPQWGEGASSWPSLVELGLSSCQLSGVLPEVWGTGGGLLKLQQLFLSYNRLTGTLPSLWMNLPALTDLWLRPGNPKLCGALPLSAGAFTVCRANGTTCVPISETLATGCDTSAASPASNVEAVVRLLGYNMLPFVAQQQIGLQQALMTGLGIMSQDQVQLLYVQQVADPLVRISQFAASNGRRRSLLNAEGQNYRQLLAPSQEINYAVQTAASIDPLNRGGQTIQAVDVTLELVADSSTQATAWGEALDDDVRGEGDALTNALIANGVNATGTQLLYNSYGDTAAGVTATTDSSLDHESRNHTIEIVVGTVSGVIVAAVIALIGLCCWRRRRRRMTALQTVTAGSTQLATGSWSKGAIDSASSSNEGRCSGSSSTQDSTPMRIVHRAQPSLVFPPLNTVETGIDIDQDNLFKGNDGGSSGDATCSSLRLSASDMSDRMTYSGSGGPTEAVQLPRVPFSDWELHPEDIHICTHPDGSLVELGAGAFGQVFKAQLGVQIVAVKMLTGQHDTAAQEQFCREIAILRSCRCANVVMFCGACVSGSKTMIVCEYMEGGDLWRILNKDRSRAVFGWYKRGKKVALDVASGLHYLHSHRIVHFDLKSQNILLARDGTAKIADVGLARVLNREYLTSLHMAGTFAWAAPELLLGSRCTEKVDIYSFGMVLWEIVTGERPLRGQIRDLRVPEECPAEVEELRLRCMAADASTRPSAKQIHAALLAIPYPVQQGGGVAGGAATTVPSTATAQSGGQGYQQPPPLPVAAAAPQPPLPPPPPVAAAAAAAAAAPPLLPPAAAAAESRSVGREPEPSPPLPTPTADKGYPTPSGAAAAGIPMRLRGGSVEGPPVSMAQISPSVSQLSSTQTTLPPDNNSRPQLEGGEPSAPRDDCGYSSASSPNDSSPTGSAYVGKSQQLPQQQSLGSSSRSNLPETAVSKYTVLSDTLSEEQTLTGRQSDPPTDLSPDRSPAPSVSPTDVRQVGTGRTPPAHLQNQTGQFEAAVSSGHQHFVSQKSDMSDSSNSGTGMHSQRLELFPPRMLSPFESSPPAIAAPAGGL